jgi:prevent-host-death family protein
MTKVGIRELKAHLSEYLRKVKDGENLTITEHGEDIAVLQPLPGVKSRTRIFLEGLEAKGVLTLPKPGHKKPLGMKTPIKLRGGKLASDIIIEDRR